MVDFFDDVIDAVSDISWSDVWDVAKFAAPIVGGIVSSSNASSANDRATELAIAATEAQADQLQLGYDERLDFQLQALENARGQLDARQTAVLDILKSARDAYAGDVRAAAAAYIQRVPAAAQVLGDLLVGNSQEIGQKMIQAAQQAGSQLRGAAGAFGTDVIGAAGRFRTDVTGAADRTREEIIASTQPLEQYLQPFVDDGREMSDRMRTIALTDPNRLTAAQRILLDDMRADMSTRLAGSGLSGSGAGIAAAMEEEARARAGIFAENQKRSDAMMGTLQQQGFQASNTLGSAKAKALIEAAGVGWEAAKLGAQAVLNAENAAAQARLQAERDAAKWGLDATKYAADAELAAFRSAIQMQWTAQQNAATAELNAGNKVADNAFAVAGRAATETGSYFDQAAKYDLATGDAIGTAAFGKREAEARSKGPVAALQGANEIADAKLWGQGLAQVTRMIAEERNLGNRPSQYGYIQTPPGTFDTMGGGNSSVAGAYYGFDDPNML